MKKLISEEVLRNFIISELDGDHIFFNRLLGQLSKNLTEFESADRNSEKAKILAHKIRGGCSYFGAYELGEILKCFEYNKSTTESSDMFERALSLIRPTLDTIAAVAEVALRDIKKSG